MADYYVFFRTWQDFTKQFPFDDFNSLRDNEICDALNAHALNWLRTNKVEAKSLLRKKKKELKEKIARRQTQFLSRPSGARYSRSSAARLPLPITLLDTIRGSRTNDLACRIACIAGWVHSSLRTFGELSPSRMLVVIRTHQVAANAARTILCERFEEQEYWPLTLRFGCISVDDFTFEQRSVLVARFMRNVTKLAQASETNSGQLATEGDIHGIVIEQAADIVPMFNETIVGKLMQEPSDAGQPPAEGAEAITIADDETSILAKIPPLDKNNGEWVTAVAVARAGRALKLDINENDLSDREAQKAVRALKTARSANRAKVRSPSGDAGSDHNNRCFRADPDDRRAFWYLKSTTSDKKV